MNNHYVYEITNIINGKKYIGKRSCNCPIKEDKYMGSGVLLKKAIKKYGVENFKKEILEVCYNEELALDREAYYIEQVKAYNDVNYYNISSGGNGGYRNFAGKTEEEIQLWKKRMSVSRKGRVFSDEWKRKLSVHLIPAKQGEHNHMYGRKGELSPVSKKVVMLTELGDVVKEFNCLREASEFLEKNKRNGRISVVCRNKKGSAFGHFWLFKSDYDDMIKNDEFKNWLTKNNERFKNRNEKMKEFSITNRQKQVCQLDKKTLELVNTYKSIKTASEITGIQVSSISRVCRHGCNSAGGFSWIFKNEYDNLTKEDLIKLFSHKYKPIPQECREKSKKKVVCLTTNQVFDSIKDAIEYFNLCEGVKISAVCKGKRKSAGKHPLTKEPLIWKFY